MCASQVSLDLNDSQLQHIESLYEQGASDVEVKAYIRKERGSFSNDLWDRWLIDEPKFAETIKTGKAVSNAWWEREGRLSLRDKDFSYTGWYMNMKNRFSWADKQEQVVESKVEHKHSGSVDVVSRISELVS